MRRPSSENSLCYAINRSRVTSISGKLKKSHLIGILNIPGAVKTFLFEPEKRISDQNISNQNILQCNEEETEEADNGKVRTKWKSGVIGGI